MNKLLKLIALLAVMIGVSYSQSTTTSTDKRKNMLDVIIRNASGESITTENGALTVGNAVTKFRDNFVIAQPDTTVWDQTWTNQGGSFVNYGGNSSGSSYLRISLDPLTAGSEYLLETKATFRLPSRFAASISASQRILGQEVEFSLIGTNDAGATDTIPAVASQPISGTITIASNVATINFATAHQFKGGDRVILTGNTEKRLNVGPVQVTVVTSTQITVPCTLANGTYTAGGVVAPADPTMYAKNSFGILAENTSAAQSSYFSRRNGSAIRYVPAQTISTLTATQTNTSPYTDAWNAASIQELLLNMQEGVIVSKAADSLVAPTSSYRLTQTLPSEDKEYKIRIRVKNLNNISRPVARIISSTKAGSTTATIVTATDHGLVAGDFIQVYGCLDITNFPNITTSTAVASVIDSTSFTIVQGASFTGTTSGGYVAVNNGSVLMPGAINLAIQSIARTNNILTVTMNTTSSGLVAGEYCNLYGMTGSAAAYEGAYKVLRQTGTTYELESNGADFVSIATGGGVIKRTDVRVHWIMELEHTRHLVELFNQNGAADAARSIPVRFDTNSFMGTLATVTTVTNLTNLLNGQAAHDAAIAGSPIRIGARALTSNYTAVASGDTADLVSTLVGALTVKPYSIPEADWTYAPAAAVVNTTDVAVKAAAGAGIRNYVTGVYLKNTNATATEVVLKDGATVIWRGHVNATMNQGEVVVFPTPLRTTANAALNFACITTGANVYVNAQGYAAP